MISRATPVCRLGVVVVHADVVGAERAVVVRVGLVVGDRVELVERFAPARVEDPQQQLILPRIVALGLGKRDAILRNVRQAHPKAIGLDAVVALALGANRIAADTRQKPAARITWDHIGIHRLLEVSARDAAHQAGRHSTFRHIGCWLPGQHHRRLRPRPSGRPRRSRR